MDRFFFHRRRHRRFHRRRPRRLRRPLAQNQTLARHAQHLRSRRALSNVSRPGLFAVAWATTRWPEANLNAAGWASSSASSSSPAVSICLSCTGIRWLGAITPIGGLAFLAGWAILVWSRRDRIAVIDPPTSAFSLTPDFHHCLLLLPFALPSRSLCCMIIGVPKEIKTEENRVAVTPTGVAGFVARNHKVLIQKGAGTRQRPHRPRLSKAAGATIVDTRQRSLAARPT